MPGVSDLDDPRFGEIERRLGYRFQNRDLLASALTHRSYANEHPDLGRPDNEKLEFLGDAVLDLVIGHMLMERYPEAREGELSVTRSQVVSEAGLTEVADELHLGEFLFLGKGEQRSGGRDKPSLLSDAVEAVVAAVYLDGGFEQAWELVARLFPSRLANVELTGYYDHKTRLQERAQELLRETPVYEVIEERGPDHAKIFVVVVRLRGRELSRAEGRSKKQAEQHAAAAAAFLLEGMDLNQL
jgi:ribonuclease III